MIGKASKKLLVIITSVIMIVLSLVNVTYPLAQGQVEISQVGTSPTANNQKVLWINAAHVDYYIHSGIVTNYSTTTITSKWGQGPVMIHSASYSPYSGTRYYYK